MSQTPTVRLHITETRGGIGVGYCHAVCRCGWRSEDVERRDDARRLGDAHLAEANGNGSSGQPG